MHAHRHTHIHTSNKDKNNPNHDSIDHRLMSISDRGTVILRHKIKIWVPQHTTLTTTPEAVSTQEQNSILRTGCINTPANGVLTRVPKIQMYGKALSTGAYLCKWTESYKSNTDWGVTFIVLDHICVNALHLGMCLRVSPAEMLGTNSYQFLWFLNIVYNCFKLYSGCAVLTSALLESTLQNSHMSALANSIKYRQAASCDNTICFH